MPMVGAVFAQETGVNRFVLSGFEAPLDRDWSRDAAGSGSPFDLETAADKVKDGSSSGRWDPARRPWVFLKKCPPDWSAYQAMQLWIYAKEANNQKINFWIYSDAETAVAEGKASSYYFYQLTVDWTGWKQVLIDFSQCNSVRSPRGWNQIRSLMISSKGGGAEPLPGNTLWLDQLELIGL